MDRDSITIPVGNQALTFETGKIGRQAAGSVLVRMGETVLFTSACVAKEAPAEQDFFPLRVDYKENFSAAGKTLSGFIKREGRPSEKEVLVSRLIDRPLRPMFPDGYFKEVQVLSYVWSYDGVHSPEPIAICAASAALMISEIPLLKAIGAVRVGFINNQFVINPTVTQQKDSKLDLMLAGTEDAILMIEGFCDFLTEEQVIQAIEAGHQAIQGICKALTQWQQLIGKPKDHSPLRVLPKELLNSVEEATRTELGKALRISQKQLREEALAELDEHILKTFSEQQGEASPYQPTAIMAAIKEAKSKEMRQMILNEGKRSDGRNLKEIRPISIEQGLLPRTHGCSLFTRGETQVMAICTLGGKGMAQRYEDLDSSESSHRFYLQYFFPPFSVGEVGRLGSPGRREVGHGKLAERALTSLLPSETDFPYTIRLEANTTESNGSSSMASVCGGCLALMDAGVPIKRPVAGIAMGLILEEGRYAILSDILGIEDALGDMDFKIAGDHEGITAFQMDIKVEGITSEIMRTALTQAKEGRSHILNKMLSVVPNSKDTISVYAPHIETVQISPDKIAKVIGTGGKQIRAIMEASGAQIDINDSGLISIAAPTLQGTEKAKSIIEGLTADVEIGQVYKGTVTGVKPFGMFVEIIPGKEGLCHISEFDHMRIQNLEDHVQKGDIVSVKVLEIDSTGRVKLSRKAVQQ